MALNGKVSVPEVLAFLGSLCVLAAVWWHMPTDPDWPGPAEFKKPEFNPFVKNPRYRPPVCEEDGFPWSSSTVESCPVDKEEITSSYNVAALECSGEKVPDAKFLGPLLESDRLHFVNFTGPVSGEAVSAMIILPAKEYQSSARPVIYALHARDQSYENMWADGSHLSTRIDKLHLGFNGWVQDTLCELNDPKMEPHILVIPMRGGDRMWIDCKDPKVCALETQITKDLVPYVDKTYKTVDNAKARGCIGYSMGASGCLNLAVKHPTIFGSVLVQSPGVWPRFVSWDELISSEGAKTSDFSTRDFLLEKVFDGKGDYESKNTCNMLDSKLRSGDELQNHRPKLRVWFGQRDPYISQDEALFGCFACNQMCQKFHIVEECMHSDFFRCLSGTDLYPDYLKELFNLFS